MGRRRKLKYSESIRERIIEHVKKLDVDVFNADGFIKLMKEFEYHEDFEDVSVNLNKVELFFRLIEANGFPPDFNTKEHKVYMFTSAHRYLKNLSTVSNVCIVNSLQQVVFLTKKGELMVWHRMPGTRREGLMIDLNKENWPTKDQKEYIEKYRP